MYRPVQSSPVQSSSPYGYYYRSLVVWLSLLVMFLATCECAACGSQQASRRAVARRRVKYIQPWGAALLREAQKRRGYSIAVESRAVVLLILVFRNIQSRQQDKSAKWTLDQRIEEMK
ncbi:uncharacterized protein LY89DRAFT_687655 [Mollisia scopiformis]|uniref:Secreted protein n=1 Tax=Mollisia scopiformis TaxID=149040 RepID=A0A194WXN0_MOLSC|nr:uncharacterized protein LY89DRAFT_687655 [Mollisia scopiformis]KUJ12685.1 hypothetical protein LY89DRAFT_687655 [Mollisia scopiformis]